jgi:hypothetical protein
VILVAGRPVPADWTRAPSILRALLSGIQTIAIAADDPSRPGYSAHWPPTVAFGGAIDWQVAWTEGAQTEHDLVAGMEAMRDHLRASDGLEWAGVTCTDREKWYEDVAIHFPLGLTPPNITTIPDLAIPDAFWWQIIGPGHTSRLHRLPPESRPAGDPNHVEVNFGEAAD